MSIMDHTAIEKCFVLSSASQEAIRRIPVEFGFGGLGAAVFYRTYSRIKDNGLNENWHDVVIRVINGIMSIRKDYMRKAHLPWDEESMQTWALKMAASMTKMQWTPPGRGLAVCGTEVMYQRGTAPLYNCGYVNLENPIEALTFSMDALMCGVGVGYRLNYVGPIEKPDKFDYQTYIIPDTREGWCQSLKLLLNAYIPDTNGRRCKFPIFDYLSIRGRGEPIKTFGGISSGPEPLRHLHIRVEAYLDMYLTMRQLDDNGDDGGFPKIDAFADLVNRLRDTDLVFLDDDFSSTIDECLRDYQNYLAACTAPRDQLRRRFDQEMRSLYEERSQIHNVDQQITTMINKMKYPTLYFLIEALPMNSDIRELAKLRQFLQTGESMSQFLTAFNYAASASSSNIQTTFSTADRQKWLKSNSKAVLELLKEHITEAADYAKMERIMEIEGKMLSYGCTRLFADIANAIGACVVSGGVRRTSEILFGKLDDPEFINLKNIYRNPERQSIMYTSNNSVSLERKDDFLNIPQLASLIQNNGEPGFFNQSNVRRFGRVHHYHHANEKYTREMEPDPADGCNPCGEAMLCSYELCNLASFYPIRCCAERVIQQSDIMTGAVHEVSIMHLDNNALEAAVRYAAFYTQTVSLGKTHWKLSNAILARNRRTGVSMGGIPEIRTALGSTRFIEMCRHAYRWVSDEQRRCASEAGVPEPIRKTVIKPDGTLSLVVGVSSGMHYPSYHYIIRRVRITKGHPCVQKLMDAGYKYEDDLYSKNTWCFEFPIYYGDVRTASTVKLREQAMLLRRLQSEFADNSVSVTLTFDPETEAGEVEHVIAELAPDVKTFSMLPICKAGVYKQMPIEGIDRKRYLQAMADIKPIDWTDIREGQAQIPRYCTGDSCEIPRGLRQKAASSSADK